MPRRHLYVLAAIVLVGLVRGGYWVAAVEFPNPVDEAHHYAYVESLARGRLPKVGEDRVSAEVLAMIKASPALVFRSGPYRASPDDPKWGTVREQYEAVQPPLYYAALVPVYWSAHPFGAVKAFYAMRMASVVIALTAVPLTWLLARRLFPSRPEVWLGGPLVLVLVEGFNGNLASITNDVLVVPVSVLVLLALVADARHRTVKSVAIAGLAFGAGMLTKSTFMGFAFVAAASYLAWWRQSRVPLRTVAGRLIVFGVAALVAFSPWIALNLLYYGALSGAKALEALQGRAVHGSIVTELDGARLGFWDLQLTNSNHTRYDVLFEVLLVLAIVASVARLRFLRRQPEDRVAAAWLGGTVVASVLGLLLITYGLIAGSGFRGRHLYIALVPAAILIAAAATAIGGRRWMAVTLAVPLLTALVLEVPLIHRAVLSQYTTAFIRPNLIPAVDQNWGDDSLLGQPVRLWPPCRTRHFGVRTVEKGPPRVVVSSEGREQTAKRIVDQEGFTVYRLSSAVDQPFTVMLPPEARVSSSQAERSPAVAFPVGYGEPVARVYCPAPNARSQRFAAVYPVQHPGRLTFRMLMDWGPAWVAIGAVALALALLDAKRRPELRPPRTPSIG